MESKVIVEQVEKNPRMRLKSARALCNMSQKQMADALGIGLTSYSERENGVRDLWLSECVAILNIVKLHDDKATLDSIFM